MNIDILHLKKTLWKSFDVFPKDSYFFQHSDYVVAYTFIYVCIPSVFKHNELGHLQYEVIKIAGSNKKIMDARFIDSCCATDGITENLKFLQRMKKLKIESNNVYNFRDNVKTLIYDYATTGYFPEKAKWCEENEFDILFQTMMFESM